METVWLANKLKSDIKEIGLEKSGAYWETQVVSFGLLSNTGAINVKMNVPILDEK